MGPGSPLHCAIFRGDKNLATLLISIGAVLDVHTAAGLGDCSGISLLLERGADIDGRCIDRHSTPVQYLCTTRPNVAQFLLSMGVQADIVSSAACGDIESINRLLSKNSDLINVRINQTSFPPGAEHNVHNTMTFSIGLDATPLHAAAKGDCSDAVAFCGATWFITKCSGRLRPGNSFTRGRLEQLQRIRFGTTEQWCRHRSTFRQVAQQYFCRLGNRSWRRQGLRTAYGSRSPMPSMVSRRCSRRVYWPL